MSRVRLLVTVASGRVRSVRVGGTPVPVPWAPDVRVRATATGVAMRGDSRRDGEAGRVATGRPTYLGGLPTTCLDAELRPDGRVLAALGPELVASGDAMLRVLHYVVLGAQIPDPVLVLGETGTGKELVARALHEQGIRSMGPFFAINLAAVPGSLVESELFGCMRGAYTGASRDRAGAFEAADGGTLFLDELAEAPPDTQAKLLRVVETGRVRRVGGTREVPTCPRLVAATHQEPGRAVALGRLRVDLLERLGCLVIRLPALRDRRMDLDALIGRLWGGPLPSGWPCVQSMRILARHSWPGNVRELRNVLRRLRWLAGPGVPSPDLVLEAIRMGWGEARAPEGNLSRGLRRRQIEASGLPRSTFYYRLSRGTLASVAGSDAFEPIGSAS